MNQRLYEFMPMEDRRLLSLNFLLSQKITVDHVSMDIKGAQPRLRCKRSHNAEYLPMIFYKHISHYLSDTGKIPVTRL